MESYTAAGRRFSQHLLFVLAVAFYRRHSSLGKCQGSFFTISSEIITFLSSVGTHIPQGFCAHPVPTGEGKGSSGIDLRGEWKWYLSLGWGVECGAGLEAPDLDLGDLRVQEWSGFKTLGIISCLLTSQNAPGQVENSILVSFCCCCS